MEAFLLDWLNILVRWLHFITGVAWIGSSLYFIWLDNHLEEPRDHAATLIGVGGEVWSVHGGGFYHAQKYKVCPTFMIKECLEVLLTPIFSRNSKSRLNSSFAP